MNVETLKIKTKLIKRPKIYNPINLKEINIQNNQNNYLFNQKKYKTMAKYSQRFKKNDIRSQILSLTYKLNDYTKKSNKNLKLINKLKTENDLLISELNNNIQKSSFFNKTTREIFHDLVAQYEYKGYKIPNLSHSHNLFKRSPLLIENKNDVDMYYKDDPSTKGRFINDMSNFKEKNWLFLNKVNKQCNKIKAYYSLNGYNGTSSKQLAYQDDYFSHSELNQMEEEKQKYIENLLKDINRLKKTIKKEEKDHLILSFEIKKKQKNYNKRKNSESFKYSNYLNKTINSYNMKNINRPNSIKKVSSNNVKLFTLRKKLSILSIDKNNNHYSGKKNYKSKFNLITELNKKNKIHKNNINNISYSNEKTYENKRIKVPGSEKLNKDIKSYFEKYHEKYKNELLKESNVDLLEKIEEIKNKIKKNDVLKIHKDYFSSSKNHQNIVKLLELYENKIYNLDKNIVKQSVLKNFED